MPDIKPETTLQGIMATTYPIAWHQMPPGTAAITTTVNAIDNPFSGSEAINFVNNCSKHNCHWSSWF